MTTIFPALMAVPAHRLKNGLEGFLTGLAKSKVLPQDVIGLTEDGNAIFNGDVLFELKATHGLPLDMALDHIINEKGMAVDWCAFFAAARRNGWWDFQIHEVICHAMEDAELPREMRAAISLGFKAYVLKYPHPKMGLNA